MTRCLVTSMKLLYITPFPPEPSGIADYAAGFAAAIARFCEVDVVASARGDRLSHSLPAVRERMRDVRQRLRSSHYDLVHVELGRSLLVSFFAALDIAIEYPKMPLVLTLHDPPGLVWHPLLFAGIKNIPLFNMAWAGLAWPTEWLLERSLYRRAAMLLTFSHRGRDLLQQQKGLQDIRVIPMGVPVYPARPASAQIRVGYYGYLYREKGVEVLIDALALLKQRQPR
ncbi:MAG TPA: glycosyltransferase, partial [Candidatus Edwardsbacteria bacterium]|nr:glycosyltransferase [Candidatus Edwardsbacteria bacterium]